MNENGDFTIDTTPQYDTSLKGNSAEGNAATVSVAMNGFGKYADFARPAEHQVQDSAPGAFIQGGNPGNSVSAGKPFGGNKEFNPTEK